MKSVLKIVLARCWKCHKEMKLAFVDDTMPVSRFNDELIDIARKHGVLIKNSYSATMEEFYNANICPHCNSMFGDWYLPDYWYEKPIESMEVEF